MTEAIVVTGGSRGIGSAIVRLASILDRPVVDMSRTAADESMPPNVLHVACDVGDEKSVDAAFAELDDRGIAVGALINSAGVMGEPTRLADCSSQTWDHIFRINARGTFFACRAAIRRMSTHAGGNGGAIVNISSMAATLGGGGEYVHYAATKGAIESLTIGLSRELAAEGIRVNAVRPGLIDTTMHDQSGDSGRLARMARTVPMGRSGSDEEVARAALWLVSEEASYITGAVLPVSGGR